jgi:hypothetical protein
VHQAEWSQVYEWFANRIRGWSYENWTSKLRSWDGYPEFTENERGYSDFTYIDEAGEMRMALQDTSTQAPRFPAKYHIEVKATPSDYTVPFFVSQNQVKMVSVRSYV